MIRHGIAIVFAMWVSSDLYSQNSQQTNKLNIASHRILSTIHDDEQVSVLIQGNTREIESFIKENRGGPKFSAGDIVCATLDKSAIIQLNTMEFVSRIEISIENYQLLNDVMVIRNNVDSAYFGYWPLEQGYDGTGVVIGIIDAPFDINHGDFKDASGHTRIKYVWDQAAGDDGTSPDPYNYGTECDSLMIENGDCDHNDYDELNYSHGSGVAGVAGSSGMAANRYRGVAPNCDLILVNVDLNENFTSNVIDGIAYIFDKAEEMGKPCVINTSLGTYAGSHDGNDLVSQIIENLIAEINGRVLVAAAGNAGNFPFHVGYEVTGTEKFTWFKKLSYANLVYFQLFADEEDLNDVFFSVGATDPATWNTLGTTGNYNVLDDFDLEGGLIDSVVFNLPGAGPGTIYAQLTDGVYQVDVLITPSAPSTYWKFGTMGSGYIDMWNAEATTGYSNYVTTGLPDAGIYPQIINYQLPNTSQSITSSWQCSEKVITVGSYVNRDSLTNYYNEQSPFTYIPETLFPSSSKGPTRDNRIKPDVCATGAFVTSTEAQILSDWLISLGAANYMSPDGMHYTYNGTSFSSPVVAGIAALYLQKNPNASYEEVLNAVTNNAKRDEFTGDLLPDNSWGYGKANAFRTLTGPWGCEDDDHENAPENISATAVLSTKALLEWDLIPNAAGYQVALQPVGGGELIRKKTTTNSKMISGLAAGTEYLVRVRAYCPGYGFSDASADYFFTTLLRTGNESNLDPLVYPNPASNTIHINGIVADVTIAVYDVVGQKLLEVVADSDQVTISTEELSNGVYFLVIGESELKTVKQIIISR